MSNVKSENLIYLEKLLEELDELLMGENGFDCYLCFGCDDEEVFKKKVKHGFLKSQIYSLLIGN